jgi:predicted ArsR family transcriptional regulator
MIRIRLDDAGRAELHELRKTELPRVARDRLEMVLLSDAGWPAPRIAAHVGCHPHTARAALKGFAAAGVAAFVPAKPGPAPDLARREQVAAALSGLLGQERTWTSRQLAEALPPLGVALSPRQVRRHLKAMDAGCRRTAQTLAHKRDPAKAARAVKVLGNLKKKRRRAA